MNTAHFAALALALALGELLTIGTASADAVVTACATDAQAGAGVNLAQALAAGGTIRFNCPPDTSIKVSGHYVLTLGTTIDGGDNVTLDGNGAPGPFLRATESIALRRIKLRKFAQPPIGPGPGPLGGRPNSVLNAHHDAVLDHVTIEANDNPIKVRGNLTVTDSTFEANLDAALVADGATEIVRSNFLGNGTGILLSAGRIRNSTFAGHTRAALRISGVSTGVEVAQCVFTETRGGPAILLSQQSTNASLGKVTLRANTFRDNDGGAGGGAIRLFDIVEEARGFGLSEAVINALSHLPPASFVLSYNRFEQNRGGRGGAIDADLARTAGMVSTGDVFIGNVATGDGGAIAVSGGKMTIRNALFKANRAGGRGAALAEGQQAQVALANSLVIGNTGPAGAIAGFAIRVANVTVADNASAGLAFDTTAAWVANTILARNRGGDCRNVSANMFDGRNSVSDATCPGMPASDAFLDALYIPADGSPALRAGDPAVCRAAPVGGVDLAFQSRLDPGGCALGAFERAPVRKFAAATDRREAHADAADDFSDDEGYRPPPPHNRNPPAEPTPSDTLLALRGVGIDFSVREAELREWLANPRFTPYPSIVSALFKLLDKRRLKAKIFLDVIVWNYEHTPGIPSPRSPGAVNLKVLKAAMVEGFNTRNGTDARDFESILR
jgi:predicted outer membrane repeat protein